MNVHRQFQCDKDRHHKRLNPLKRRYLHSQGPRVRLAVRVRVDYNIPEMFDGFNQFQLFGCLPGSGAGLLEDGEGASIGESVGVIAFVRADFRAARKARDA